MFEVLEAAVIIVVILVMIVVLTCSISSGGGNGISWRVAPVYVFNVVHGFAVLHSLVFNMIQIVNFNIFYVLHSISGIERLFLVTWVRFAQ
jgi:hypothetical protein